MVEQEPLLNYKYNQEEFFCHSCLNWKPISALKERNTKRHWCITCFDKMIDNKELSHASKQSERFLRKNIKKYNYKQGFQL